jgi:hypothetical protein
MVAMSYYSFSFPRRRPHTRTALAVERLEDRRVLSCATISGFVYHDANQNGLRDPGESAVAGSVIELHDASGQLVATAVADTQGFYQFDADPRIDTSPATKEYDLSFPQKPTDWTASQTVPQFDPALGTLTSVEIRTADLLTSTIKIENLDSSTATIHSSVKGTASASGPAFSPPADNLTLDQTFFAGAFDGTIDFGGTSGKNYGAQKAPGARSAVLTAAADLAPYVGTGAVTFTETTRSTAAADGTANLVLQVNTTVSANIRVIYHYTPANCLATGLYTVVQPAIPAGYLAGLKTSGNQTPIPGSAGVNSIPVTLRGGNSTENNFAELLPAGLSGYVYHDVNADGALQWGEPAIPGTTVTLTGVDDLGPVSQVRTSAADGSYEFTGLRPGIYTLAESQPAGFLDGRDTVGTQGGVAGNDQLSNLPLSQGTEGVWNNFGEVRPASLSGSVYYDANNNGVREAGEPGIGGVLITLTGIDDLGNPVQLGQRTAADGTYAFMGLRPGTYVLSEAQPPGYLDGEDSIGTQGGLTGNDRFSDLRLASGTAGADNNFGELRAASGGSPQIPSLQPPLTPPSELVGKEAFLASHTLGGGA